MSATFAGAFVGIVTATVNLAVMFGFTFTDGQRTAIIAEATAITVIAPLVGRWLDHSKQQAEARSQAAVTIAQGK